MITYERFAFGLNLLFRVHGSATYRNVLPGATSVLVLYIIQMIQRRHPQLQQDLEVEHPYAIGVVVSGITFLIVFRASQGYSRYWEATSSVYDMMSKWMDATVHTASYHMQAKRYDKMKPPSYNDYPDLDGQHLTRDRERVRTKNEVPSRNKKYDRESESESSGASRNSILHKRAVAKSINLVLPQQRKRQQRQNQEHEEQRTMRNSIPTHPHNATKENSNTNFVREPSYRQFTTATMTPLRKHYQQQQGEQKQEAVEASTSSPKNNLSSTTNVMNNFLTGGVKLDGNWGALYSDGLATYYDPQRHDIPLDPRGFASTQGGRTPPLFLQELAHLSSLMTAVAMATLRNDIDGAESPLDYYEPGTPWPAVDPGDIPELYVNGWARWWETLRSFLGRGRTPLERTRYNALRPLPVLGGVSEAEIRFLQLARGPYAKTQLCWHWISEFITREHLAGSLGNVGPPIISRIIQFLGDGMTQYNHGRKIMSIPFPFVHAQHSAIFVLVMMGVIPFLMDQYCDDFWAGALLTFLSVVCLSGIHEVARELENPFRNVPNELPVVTLMAEYNEALVTMYAGYHPDFFWEPPPSSSSSSSSLSAMEGDGDNDDYDNDDANDSNGIDKSKDYKHMSSDDASVKSDAEVGVVQERDYSIERSVQDVTEDETDPGGTTTPTASLDKKSDGGEADSTVQAIDDSVRYDAPASVQNGPVQVVDEQSRQLDQLRAIVLEQGRAMSKMLEEQARLNKLLQNALGNAEAKDGGPTSHDVIHS